LALVLCGLATLETWFFAGGVDEKSVLGSFLQLWDFYWDMHAKMMVAFLSCIVSYVALYAYMSCKYEQKDLFSATYRGDVQTVVALLEGDNCREVNSRDLRGRTPLQLACLAGHDSIVEVLTARSECDPNIKTGRAQWSAIHYAASRGHPLCIKVLHTVKADMNSQLASGETPLHLAAARSHVEAVKTLLRSGCDPTIRNNSGLLPADITSLSLDIREVFTSVDQYSPDLEEPVVEAADATEAPVEVEKVAEGQLGSICEFNDPQAQELAWSRPKNLSTFLLAQGGGVFGRVLLSEIREEDEDGQEPSPVQKRHDSIKPKKESTKAADKSLFKEIKKLGQGAFGSVFLVEARHTRAGVQRGKRYAMKVLEKQKFEAQRITKYAFGERNVLKSTRHPFLVHLFCAYQVAYPTPQWVLIMEFAPGGALNDKIISTGTPGLALPLARRYSAEILVALEYLHHRKVIYRDLKPENVVLSAKDHVKITDFGLAKSMGDSDEAKSVCGSYGYVAPEIGRSKYTTAVDLYSLGVTIFMLVSGGIAKVIKGQEERLPPMTPEELSRELVMHLPETPQPGVPNDVLEDGMMIVDRAGRRRQHGYPTEKWFEDLQKGFQALVRDQPKLADLLAQQGWRDGQFPQPPSLGGLQKILQPRLVKMTMPRPAVDLIQTLTKRMPHERGTDQSTKEHPFFEGIDWETLVPEDELAACTQPDSDAWDDSSSQRGWSFAG